MVGVLANQDSNYSLPSTTYGIIRSVFIQVSLANQDSNYSLPSTTYGIIRSVFIQVPHRAGET